MSLMNFITHGFDKYKACDVTRDACYVLFGRYSEIIIILSQYNLAYLFLVRGL